MLRITKPVIFFLLAMLSVSTQIRASDSSTLKLRNSNPPENSFGLGIGPAFGGAGVSYDRVVSDRIVLTAAVGDRALAPGRGYNVGAKL